MTELVLFGLVGLFAVGFAIAMLLSDNAVHSALFLIGTMGCIAFLFLLLNAPFLAMIQVTVYTGAIMVLFLFVIMLLGAERLQDADREPDARRFPWYIPLAIGLVIAFVLIVGLSFTQVHLDLRTDTAPLPQLRVLNAAPDAGAVDVFANDQQIASAVAFRANSDYVTLQPGDYTIKVQPVKGAAVTTKVSLARGTQQTVLDYGDTKFSVSVVSDDNSTVSADRSARLTIFNADSGLPAVKLVDLGSSLSVTNAPVLVDTLKSGQAASALIEPEGTVNWAFVDAANPQNVVYRLENYTINRDTSGLLVLTNQRIFDGSQTSNLRPVGLPLVSDAAPEYGSPQAIGLQLFTNYMLVFQLLAVVLLAAMVGAIVLTHREKKAAQTVGGRRVVSRPLVNVIAAQVGHEVTSENAPELQEPADAAPVGK